MSKQPRRLVQQPTLGNAAPMMVCAAVLLTVLAVYFFIVNSRSWLLFAAVMCVAAAALIAGLVSWVGFHRDQVIYADYLAERDDALRHNDAVVERERAGVSDDDVILSQDPVESGVDWDDPRYVVDDETEVDSGYEDSPQRRETSPAAALVGAAAGAAGTAAVAGVDNDDSSDGAGFDAVEFEQAPEEPAATTLMDEVGVTESDVDEAVSDEGDEGVLFGDDEVGLIDSEGASDPVLDEFFGAEDTDLPTDEYEVEDAGSSLINLDTDADADADADAAGDADADDEADATTYAAADVAAAADVDTPAAADAAAETKDEQESSLGGFSLLGFTDEETR